jgi:hypothetical protein
LWRSQPAGWGILLARAGQARLAPLPPYATGSQVKLSHWCLHAPFA